MGLFAPKDLLAILDVINKHDVPKIKITGAQRLALLGMDKDLLPALQEELKKYVRKQPQNGVHYVQACPGNVWCKFGKADALALGERIEQMSLDTPLKAKVKVGVSGCRMCCTEPYVRDVGVFASKNGWTLLFGGNGAGNPRLADTIATGLNDEETLDLIKRCLTVFQEKARPRTRSARFMEGTGVDAFKKLVLE